jgi:hypothetical protein
LRGKGRESSPPDGINGSQDKEALDPLATASRHRLSPPPLATTTTTTTITITITITTVLYSTYRFHNHLHNHPRLKLHGQFMRPRG